MTTFAVNNGWTPELIAQDKALKEKYGQGAHITPVRTFEIPANMNKLDSDTVELEGKVRDKKLPTVKKALYAGIALTLATGAYLFTKGRVKNISTDDVQKVANNIVDELSELTPNAVRNVDNLDKSQAVLSDVVNNVEKNIDTTNDVLTNMQKKADDVFDIKVKDSQKSQNELLQDVAGEPATCEASEKATNELKESLVQETQDQAVKERTARLAEEKTKKETQAKVLNEVEIKANTIKELEDTIGPIAEKLIKAVDDVKTLNIKLKNEKVSIDEIKNVKEVYDDILNRYLSKVHEFEEKGCSSHPLLKVHFKRCFSHNNSLIYPLNKCLTSYETVETAISEFNSKYARTLKNKSIQFNDEFMDAYKKLSVNMRSSKYHVDYNVPEIRKLKEVASNLVKSIEADERFKEACERYNDWPTTMEGFARINGYFKEFGEFSFFA